MPKFDRDLFITILTVLIPVIFQLFYIKYVSYSVDKTIYGNFILLQTLIAGLSYIFLQIPSQAFDRFYNTTENKIEFVNEFRTILILINILSLLVIIVYDYSMRKFSYEVLFIIFIYFVILNNYSFNQKVFLLNLDRNKFFFLKVMESTAKFIAPIIAYYYFQSLISFLLGMVIGYLISFFILMKYMKDYKFSLILKIDNLKKYFIFSYPILFVSLCTWGISFSDRYFIEFLANTEEVAIYAILAQVAALGQIVGQVYTLYVNPMILKMFEEDKEEALCYLSRMLNKLAIVFTILIIIAFILPTRVYEILLQPQIIKQKYYFFTFFILLIGIFITVYQTAYSMYLVLYKRLNVLAYIYLPALIVNLIGNLYIEKYGISAAAISTLMAYLIILFGQIAYVRAMRLNQRV